MGRLKYATIVRELYIGALPSPRQMLKKISTVIVCTTLLAASTTFPVSAFPRNCFKMSAEVARQADAYLQKARSGKLNCSEVPAGLAFALREEEEAAASMDCAGFSHPPVGQRNGYLKTKQELESLCIGPKKTSKNTQPAPPAPSPHVAGPPAAMPKSASCSDITGTGGGTTATDCRSGDLLSGMARELRTRNPAAARENYQRAADAYRRAGDTALANAILAEAQSLIASLPANPPPLPPVPQMDSGALGPLSLPPPQPPPASPDGPQAALPKATQAPESNACPIAVAPASPLQGANADYCANANCVDRGSAYYGYVCYPPSAAPASAANLNPRPYNSPVNPRELTAQALKACPDTMALERQRTCIEGSKLQYLFAHDPNVAAECAAIRDPDQQLACANVVYLYGPRAPWQPGQKKVLWTTLDDRLAAKLPEWVKSLTALPPKDGPLAGLPRNPCPAGEGVMPIPVSEGGNGAWGCRPLWGGAVAGDRQTDAPQAGSDADTQKRAQALDAKMKEIASLVAGAIAPKAGERLPVDDRATCTAAAYAAVLGMMKGGTPPLPAMCDLVINPVRTEFAFYASNYLFADDRGLAELLAVLAIRYGGSGGPVLGNLDLPDPKMSEEYRRQADCIARGGSFEECMVSTAR